MSFRFFFLGLALAIASTALAGTPNDVSGTFQNPSARSRPRFRYWLPDPGVERSIVAANIKSAGDIGSGGVEFLDFYNYNGQIPGPDHDDWVVNGFGTPAFNDMFRAALNAHKEKGLVMDFPLGPGQGQGVPAKSDDEGLQWDLVCLTLFLWLRSKADSSQDSPFSGRADEWRIQRSNTGLGNWQTCRSCPHAGAFDRECVVANNCFFSISHEYSVMVHPFHLGSYQSGRCDGQRISFWGHSFVLACRRSR